VDPKSNMADLGLWVADTCSTFLKNCFRDLLQTRHTRSSWTSNSWYIWWSDKKNTWSVHHKEHVCQVLE